MKKFKPSIAFKGGTYSAVLTVVVLAILIVVNVLFSAIPEIKTKLDISSNKLYSITSNTKVVVNNLEKDVTIYWITQANQENSILEKLLEKYESSSKHIKVVKKNPDVYPTFASQYTDETVANNSLIVESGEKSRYISYDDIFVQELDYETYSYTYSFDGEGAITSAIDYVVREEVPKVYITEGHGEAALSDEFNSQITKANMETESITLLNQDSIPEDAACLMIYAPSTDISEDEAKMLSDYVSNGGKLLVFSSTTENGELPNLNSLLSNYGVTAENGVVIETDRSHYASQAPFVLMPEMISNDITDPLIDENYSVIVPIATGLTIGSTTNGTVTSLLETSDDAFSKIAGYEMTTYDEEEGDIDGPFSLAVSISDNSGGQMIWIGSQMFLYSDYNSYSSGANLNFSMNALSSLVGENEAIAIRSKSLGYEYLTIADDNAKTLKILLIGFIPLAFVASGVAVLVYRRKKNNEAI